MAARRMRRGIAILDSDPLVERAFRVMNSVMQMQRERQEMIRGGANDPAAPVVAEWRPFQIAFILMNLEGLADPTSDDRGAGRPAVVPDRRRQDRGLPRAHRLHHGPPALRGAGADGDGAGVAVIMRYTLRLLTLQQFERAAGLICALEVSTRRSRTAGQAPFSIGLWVGQGATPNNVDDAAKALSADAGEARTRANGDPVQLLRCPWCGTASDRRSLRGRQEAGSRDRPLPRNATVRFRAMACRSTWSTATSTQSAVAGHRHRGQVRDAGVARRGGPSSARGHGRSRRTSIVQDELHLISGPLGTMVGLYETAVDRLATDRRTGTRPRSWRRRRRSGALPTRCGRSSRGGQTVPATRARRRPTPSSPSRRPRRARAPASTSA